MVEIAENSNTQPVAGANAQPESTNQKVVKPTAVQSGVKKGRKLSPKAVVFGCIGFIVIFILGLFGALYVGLQNPSRLANIGIEPSSAKSLLMIIAAVFFGVIFLFGFGFLAINTYRLIRGKGGSKVKYFIGMFFGVILLGIAIGLGAVAITKVQGIKVENYANTDELVVPYLITSSNNSTETEYTYALAPGVAMIAPLDIAYQINESIVNLKYENVAGNNTPLSMVLDCGNGTKQTPSQKVNGNGYLAGDNPFFDSTCLYITKGTYTPQITFTYRDPIKQQNQTFSIPAGTLVISAELTVTANGKPIFTNSGNSEIIVGDAPTRVQIDAKNIFSELGITDNNIVRDMNSDGTPDKENKVTFGYNYLDPQLYTVSYRFPSATDEPNDLLWYHFYLRVNQSDTPRCTVNTTNDGNTYKFNTVRSGGAEASAEINSYRREIYDIDNEETVQSIPARTDSLEYSFTKQGNYTARLSFSTVDNAQGLCESDVLHAGAPAYDIAYTISYKKPWQANFTAFPTKGAISQNGDNIVIDTLPLDIQIRVTDISPKPASSVLSIKIDNDFMIKKSTNIFETTVSDRNDHTIVISLQDEQGTKTDKTLTLTLNQSVIQGVLKADVYKGTEPLTVNLDASTTKLNDDKDEIIYFTWDFDDDGEVAKNVSQGKISHIYLFNQERQSGQYKPKVTITTKKWYQATFAIDADIFVTRKASTVELTLPSHPTQVAVKNTPVDMEMNSDGPISKITWEFGDGKEFFCNDRSCAKLQHAYTTAGEYTINVRVEYQDRPFAVDSIKLKVE